MLTCFPDKLSGSARVFGYSVFRGVLNRVYGILQLKYGYSVYHFLWISGIKYSKLRLFLGIFGGIWGILGYFVDFFSGILVFHYPPWPTLSYKDNHVSYWSMLLSLLCYTTVGDHLFPDQIGKSFGIGLWRTLRKTMFVLFNWSIQESYRGHEGHA